MLLLERLPGLESLAWNDGTPFADEVTRSWITRQVLPQDEGNWLSRTPTAPVEEPDNDVLALEPEALALADREGVDAALGWLQSRAGIDRCFPRPHSCTAPHQRPAPVYSR